MFDPGNQLSDHRNSGTHPGNDTNILNGLAKKSDKINPQDLSLNDLKQVAKGLAAEMHLRGHENLVPLYDEQTGVRGFLAIHSTALGPALGGARLKTYSSAKEAAMDALNLAEGMSNKAYLAGLPLGGGKSVLIAPPEEVVNEEAFFPAVGEAFKRALLPYIAAEDFGTTVPQLELVQTTYPFVVGTSSGVGDPSIHTARGVFLSMTVVNEEILKNKSFENITVAIQGVGKVGMHLAEMLYEAGANLIVADKKRGSLEKVLSLGDRVRIVRPEDVLAATCDILCPCAAGEVITEDAVNKLNTQAIVGSANNIVFRDDDSIHHQLAKRGVFYALDSLVNAGGLIKVAEQVGDKLASHFPQSVISAIKSKSAEVRTDQIPLLLIKAIKEAQKEGIPCSLKIRNDARAAVREAGERRKMLANQS